MPESHLQSSLRNLARFRESHTHELCEGYPEATGQCMSLRRLRVTAGGLRGLLAVTSKKVFMKSQYLLKCVSVTESDEKYAQCLLQVPNDSNGCPRRKGEGEKSRQKEHKTSFSLKPKLSCGTGGPRVAKFSFRKLLDSCSIVGAMLGGA